MKEKAKTMLAAIKGISISDNGDGTATLVVPAGVVPALEECLFVALRNEQIQARFIDLRRRMKVDDAFALLGEELLRDGISLSRSSLVKIVYPLPAGDHQTANQTGG